MNEEYIDKTREAVEFLTHIYSEDMAAVASILSYLIKRRVGLNL